MSCALTIFLSFLLLKCGNLLYMVVGQEFVPLWDYSSLYSLLCYYVLIMSIIKLPSNDNCGALSFKG